MQRFFSLVFLFAASLFSQSALSFNLDFLHTAASRYFDAQDWKMANAASDTALDKLPVGQKAVWKNPESSNEGFSEVLGTSTQQGMPCKKLKIHNHATHQKMTSNYVFNFCKHKDGWKIV